MFNIHIDSDLREKCPKLSLGCILADVENTAVSSVLWDDIELEARSIRAKVPIERLRDLCTITDTKSAYRCTGKDPNRYRPSADSLFRRIIKGNSLYQVNVVVDVINLLSLYTGFSIGGYDYNMIQGDILFRIAGDEFYEGIGRSVLNIRNLPMLFDSVSPFGCPTSDSVRTQITVDTKKVLLVFYNFSSDVLLDKALKLAEDKLKTYANASNVDVRVF